jgi:hypothetical protein
MESEIKRLERELDSMKNVRECMEKHKSGEITTLEYLWTLAKMAKQPQDQLLSDQVATSEDKSAILIQMIKRPSAFDDFLSLGT